MIKNKMRWRKELLDIEKNQTKDFDILNLQDAHETGIALVELCGPLGSPYEGYTFRLSYNGRNIPFEPPIIQFL
jgi:ubiquitin-protein ligase